MLRMGHVDLKSLREPYMVFKSNEAPGLLEHKKKQTQGIVKSYFGLCINYDEDAIKVEHSILYCEN